nr:uncharacterized protein LOC114925962 [Arachis hypogaea]
MRRDVSEGEKVRGGERERPLARGVGAAFRRRVVRSHHRNAYRRESRGLRGSTIALLLPSRRQFLPSIRTLAIAVEDATAATAVNWDQNCCCVPRAVMEVADSVPILPLLRLTIMVVLRPSGNC